MFFLISYGLLNYATYFEARTQSPSFRPRFKWFSPPLSLLGFIICLGAMLAIDPKSGAAAIALLFAVYQYLKRTAGPARGPTAPDPITFSRFASTCWPPAKTPRMPVIGVPNCWCSPAIQSVGPPLLTVAAWIEGGSGFTEAVQIIEGEGRRCQEGAGFSASGAG